MAISTPRRLAIAVLLILLAGAVWFGIDLYPRELLQTAANEALVLCNELATTTECPTGSTHRRDPWGNEYRCRAAGAHVQVYSLGADNQVGGLDGDSDVTCTPDLSVRRPGTNSVCSCDFVRGAIER